LSEIRRKLGFLEDDDDFDDLVVIDEPDNGEAWVPFREVLYPLAAQRRRSTFAITCE